jgi:hypothetical protein
MTAKKTTSAKGKKPKAKSELPRQKREVPEHVKQAADRAEARAAGKDPKAPKPAKDKAGTKATKSKGEKATETAASVEEILEIRRLIEEEQYEPKLGRPSKYKPEYAAVARALCKRGATDYELADEFKVDVRTILRWKVAHDDFCQALKVHKEDFDDQIERGLAQRANGFTMETEKIFCHMGKVTRAKVLEYHPPDVGAAKLWLTNRRPDKWRDKTSTELTGKDGGAIEIMNAARQRVAERMIELKKRKKA